MRDFWTKANGTAPLSTGILDAKEDNVRFEELENIVTRSGVKLDPPTGPDTSKEMLARAMTRHASGAVWCKDTGSANAHVLVMAGAYRPTAELFHGLRCEFVPAAANSGATTVDAFGLGPKPLYDYTRSPAPAGAIDGYQTVIYYRTDIGPGGAWYLPRWADARFVKTTPDSPPEILPGEGWTVNASDEGDLHFPGLQNEASLADTDTFAFYDDSAGGHREIAWSDIKNAVTASNEGGLLGVQLITATGSYTPTSGTKKALAIAVGGGGGGGAGLQAAAGGGGGGCAISLVDVAGVTTIACEIGAGGAGGVATGSTKYDFPNGEDGGTTYFGNTVQAGGGKGGWGTSAFQLGSYNKTNIGLPQTVGGDGGAGLLGAILLSGCGGEAAGCPAAGAGGKSFLGGGGRGANYHVGYPNGSDGGNYGGGGAGGERDCGTSGGNGGNGAPGCILIIEFA